jgi:hypothetical protein
VLLGGFVGVVALFAWLFTIIGRRGYGESQVCHSLAVARPLGDGRFEVTHWSHAFATSGDLYRLAYPGGSQVYAAESREGEKVRGRVVLGKDAFFDADIPLFSFRNFIHRGAMSGEDFSAQMTSFNPAKPSGWKDSFAITLGGKIPGTVIRMAVQIGDMSYPLRVQGNRLVISDEGQAGVSALSLSRSGGDDYDYGYYRNAEEALRKLRDRGTILALRSGGEPRRLSRYFGRPPGPDTVRLYIYTNAPGIFRMAGDQFATGQNFILFVQDFPASPTPGS